MIEKKGHQDLTLSDIAEKAGVSRSLASLALRGEPGVAPEKRARILEVAAELNYRPNPIARKLASRAPETLGVVVGRIVNPYVAMLVQAIDVAARRADKDVVLAINAYPVEEARSAVQRLLAHRVAGIIIVDAMLSDDDVRAISTRVPVVYVGRQLSSLEIDTVSTDNVLGATMAVEHLLNLGHTAIIHIDGGNGDGATRRRAGYSEAMQRAGLNPRVYAADYSIDAGARATAELLAKNVPVTAIFAANDLVAIGAMNEIRRRGLSIPNDIAVIGYDDMPLAGSETVSLTTIRQLVDQIAEGSIETLLRRIDDSSQPVRKQLISPVLVVRRSTVSDQGN
jgi:DNA-binding LacI/PurR family transcriptional regulator